jgi:hypothetical protein
VRDALVFVVAVVWLLVAGVADAQVTVIDQIPMDAEFGFSGLSDSDCTFGDPNRSAARAEDFIVTDAVDIDTIVFWGVYVDEEAPSDPETFRILIHANAAGLPGAVITEPTPTIAQSLLLQSNISMYEFVATFAPIHLEPGTYWAEIFETDTSTTLCFNWQAGFLDADSGSDGNAVDLDSAPGTSWVLQSGLGDQSQLTIRITGELSTETVTPSPSPTASPTASATPTTSMIASATPTGSPTASATATISLTASATATTSPTASPSPTTSPTGSPSPTPLLTPTASSIVGGAAPAIPTLSGTGGALLGLMLAALALALLARLRAR